MSPAALAGPRPAPAGAPVITPGGVELHEREFRSFQSLIESASGIYLSDAKRPLLARRLASRLRELGLTSFLAYYRRVRSSSQERDAMLDRVTTNETHFFREPRQLAVLAEQVLPAWRAGAEAGLRPRRVRAWSAACASGEEAYSVAMLLLQHFPRAAGWRVEVLGTDLSQTALATARAAEWPLERSSEIPRPYLERFMLRGTGRFAGRMCAGEELRETVTLGRLNLCGDSFPDAGRFDLVLCRNALIYFRQQTRLEVVRRLMGTLAPDGVFLVGHAESLSGHAFDLRSLAPTVYRPADLEAAP